MAPKRSTAATPLVDDMVSHTNKAYSLKPHATFIKQEYGGCSEVMTDYEPLKFSSFRVLTSVKGTILENPVLLIEQALITIIFAMCALPVYIYFNTKAESVGADDMSMRKWLDSQETRMREFAMIMTILASLLLSFYTGMSVSRWWVIRTAGVGGIKAAAMELEMLVSQMVTQEPLVLEAIRRYARSSLILVFMWRQKKLGPNIPKDKAIVNCQVLVAHGLLSEGEVVQLANWNHCLHETIWAWQSALVAMLHQEGKIRSDMLLKTLLERVSDGRNAVQCIHTHLAVKIPMQYVHLLGLLVKLHNLVLCIIMGSLFGAAVRSGEIIICAQLFGRTTILPLLFNAILLINAELSDPFDGSVSTDFPGGAYSNGLEADANAIIMASQHQPDWMARRNPLPV